MFLQVKSVYMLYLFTYWIEESLSRSRIMYNIVENILCSISVGEGYAYNFLTLKISQIMAWGSFTFCMAIYTTCAHAYMNSKYFKLQTSS